ncbi:hypothetical protein M422DRAFT_173812, partial [Sphaerobolus stellatus SS14]
MRPTYDNKHIFNPECIATILQAVTIGDSLTPTQRERVVNLISTYTDMFTLTLSEVKPNKHTEHRINVPPDAN